MPDKIWKGVQVSPSSWLDSTGGLGRVCEDLGISLSFALGQRLRLQNQQGLQANLPRCLGLKYQGQVKTHPETVFHNYTEQWALLVSAYRKFIVEGTTAQRVARVGVIACRRLHHKLNSPDTSREPCSKVTVKNPSEVYYFVELLLAAGCLNAGCGDVAGCCHKDRNTRLCKSNYKSPPTIENPRLGTKRPVSLAEANELLQLVKGTSASARYWVVAVGTCLNVAARIVVGRKISLSVRVESVDGTNRSLVDYGLMDADDHWSVHLSGGSSIIVYRALGGVLGSLPGEFTKMLLDLKKIPTEEA